MDTDAIDEYLNMLTKPPSSSSLTLSSSFNSGLEELRVSDEIDSKQRQLNYEKDLAEIRKIQKQNDLDLELRKSLQERLINSIDERDFAKTAILNNILTSKKIDVKEATDKQSDKSKYKAEPGEIICLEDAKPSSRIQRNSLPIIRAPVYHLKQKHAVCKHRQSLHEKVSVLYAKECNSLSLCKEIRQHHFHLIIEYEPHLRIDKRNLINKINGFEENKCFFTKTIFNDKEMFKIIEKYNMDKF